MSKTLVKMPIDATHSDGNGNIIIRVGEASYMNLNMKDALLFMQALATAINDEFGRFDSVAT